MSEIGKVLKTKREELGFSLTEVSMHTKISLKVLKALEAGDKENWPALSYLRGFIRIYATFLKLDPVEMVEKFNSEHDEKKILIDPDNLPATEPLAGSEPDRQSPQLPFIKDSGRKVFWWAGATLVLLLGVAFLINSLVEKYSQESETKQIAQQVEEIRPLENTKAVNPPAPSAEAQKLKKGSAEGLAQKETTSAPPQPLPASNPTTAAEVAVLEKKNEGVAELAQEESEVEKAPQEIILEALDQVRVSFQINSEPTRHLGLEPDQVHTIKLVGKMRLDLSDGGAVNLIVNGRDRGVPGDLGKPISMKLP